MKLAHPDIHFIIDVSENRFPVFVLERPDVYCRFISQFCSQTEGTSGPFVLSENWEPLDIGKTVMLVTDLFHIDLNGRKQTNALSRYLNALAVSEQFIQSTIELKDNILRWIVDLENELPFVTVHNEPFDIGTIIKAAGIRFDDGIQDISERICSLIKICAWYLNVRLLVMVGLHTSMDGKTIQEIYKTAMYEKLSLLDIERYIPEDRLPCEEYYIIDRDNCEIYNDTDNESL